MGKRIGSLAYIDGPVPLTEGEDEFVDKHVERVSFTDIGESCPMIFLSSKGLRIVIINLQWAEGMCRR